MPKFRGNNKAILLVVTLIALGIAGVNISQERTQGSTSSQISEQRKTHILHGDRTGGGHLYGTNKPCKSEFPRSWDEEEIINEINLIAANDNLNWERKDNGYFVTEQKVGSVKIRVVKGRDAKSVITAYPLNTGRNPCPARTPANDD